MSWARGRRVVIHTAEEIARIRAAARVAADVRDELKPMIRPGLTTLAVDRIVADMIRRRGAVSAFHNYRGFPGQVCVSLNDEVVHGIGRMDRVIQPGDLVSVDIGVRLAGGIGDTAFTVSVGPPRWRQALDLLRAAEESLTAGIAAAGAGHFVNDIGTAVERVVRRAGFSVVRDFVGHGCGTELHEPPEVPNFSQSSRGERLRPGMVLAIEPMVNTGASEVTVDSDGWTVRTADGGLSAHVEHMVLVTTGEPEVLTWPRTA